MKLLIATLMLGAIAASAPLAAVWAGPIETACLRSDRGGNRALCGCIQNAADLTLSRSDQKTAAKFFADPNKAQEIRQSDRSSHERFWLRYKNFGAAAEAYCGG
jgi:hypothetical protein